MLGLVLCGGKSSRMGTDKGLLKLEAKTWAQTAMDKMVTLGINVKISVNNNQFPAYSEVFSEGDLVADNKTLSLNGPLLGVLSTHIQFPSDDLFILACDMPLIEPVLLEELKSRFSQNGPYDAHIYTNDNQPEPLCGIYTAKGLATILRMLFEGRLIKHSMKFILENLQVDAQPATDDQKKLFRNFNAHAELNGL